MIVRPIEARDEPRWRELFAGYLQFYEHPVDEQLMRHAWKRIMDPKVPVFAAVAEIDGRVVGIANYLLHESTWALVPVCYLQDLFVDPQVRANGIGKALIDWLLAQMKANGWNRVYWATRETNYRARGLYDKYTPHSGFLRYVVMNKNA